MRFSSISSESVAPGRYHQRQASLSFAFIMTYGNGANIGAGCEISQNSGDHDSDARVNIQQLQQLQQLRQRSFSPPGTLSRTAELTRGHTCQFIGYAIIRRITPYTCIALLRIQARSFCCIQHYCGLLLLRIMGWLQCDAPGAGRYFCRTTLAGAHMGNRFWSRPRRSPGDDVRISRH